MAKEREKEKVKRWTSRIKEANKAYDKWSKDFKVLKSKRYWKGFQRSGGDRTDESQKERVIVNLIAPSVAIRMPSLYFYHPYARITGSPARSDTPLSELDVRARLLQDTANTIIRDPATGFRFETLIALKESAWAFGVIEVGYSAEYVDNPAFKRPPLFEDEKIKEDIGVDKESKDEDETPEEAATPGEELSPSEPPMDEGDEAVSNLKQIIDNEQFYVRRIPAEQFRCSVNGMPTLEQNDWVGYYEWMHLEDVKASPAYSNTASLKSTGKLSDEFSVTLNGTDGGENSDDDLAGRERSGMIKVWKIWSLRDRVRYVLAEGGEKFLLKEKYGTLPLHILRFEEQTDDFYPVPPVFPMLGPQDEYNDSREMLRGLRTSIYPRYTYDDSIIDESEKVKLENGGPGVIAKARHGGPDPIKPVLQVAYDSSIVRTLVVSKDDLLQVSGISGEQRGATTDATATQANIVDQRAQIRESFGRERVAQWLSSIIGGIIKLAVDKMSLPMWILRNVDPYSPGFLQESANIAESYHQLTLEALKDADSALRWDVNIDVQTLSPLTEETERAQWTQALGLLAAPAMATLLASSPELLKKTLDVFGIRSARDQGMIGAALNRIAMMAQAAAMAKAGGQPGMPSPAAPGGEAPPQLGSGSPGGPPTTEIASPRSFMPQHGSPTAESN
jgi:hypothetical protein